MSRLKWTAFGASVIGASHIRKGLKNQDACRVYADCAQETDVKPVVVAVSDGHGGSKYIRSEIGSDAAVRCMVALAEQMDHNDSYLSSKTNKTDMEESTRHIKTRFLLSWQKEVDRHYEENPFTSAEIDFLAANCAEKDKASVENNPRVAYGCTFLCVIAYKDLVMALQYGDGDILGLYPESDIRELVVADARNMGNQTLSLCTLANPGEMQHTILVGRDIPLLITLSTDGVKNSFEDSKTQRSSFFTIPNDLKNLLAGNAFDTQKATAVLERELERYTANGSGDDVTMGVLFAQESIESAVRADDTPEGLA